MSMNVDPLWQERDTSFLTYKLIETIAGDFADKKIWSES